MPHLLARYLRRMTPVLWIAGYLAASAVGGTSTHQEGASTSRSPVQSPAVVPANLGWRFHGNDLGNQRYVNADQINPSNVSQLKPAWVFHVGVFDPQASLEVTPIVVGDTMYVTSGHDDLFALDATTGTQKWGYHPLAKDMPPLKQLFICCGRDNRGVVYGNGKVYMGRFDDVLVALDANTGAVIWKSRVADYHRRYSITMAPQLVNGLVIVGVAGGEYKVRGQVVAFDANTGAEVWRTFTTVPGTWAGTSWKTGGAPVWTTPAADSALDLLYINTGNASPNASGVQRAGQNLYSSSIVALEISTGKVIWHFQEVHHDLWDYDGPQPVVLFSLAKNGQVYPALSHCNKNGNCYILDRRNGAPLYPVTERPVPTLPAFQHPWPTQPASSVETLIPPGLLPGTVDRSKLPDGVVPSRQYTPPGPTRVLIAPGSNGGAAWPSAAFSPRTRFMYYGARYNPFTYQSFPDSSNFFGSVHEEGITGVKTFGMFGAINTTTGKVAWRFRVRQPAKSCVLAAGDLVFFGEGNGKFHAVNAATGAPLWSFDGTSVLHGGGAQAGPISYVVNGRQFVVTAFGGNAEDRRQFPPNLQGDAIVAFALPRQPAK